MAQKITTRFSVILALTAIILTVLPQIYIPVTASGTTNKTIDTIPRDPQANHKPIYIVGDTNFTEENGVIGGEGTKENPYIIANWVIKANMTITLDDHQFNTGIYIANTTKYFIIRNVTIYDGDFGILLINVTNFKVSNTTISRCNFGIHVEGEDGVIENNYIYNIENVTNLNVICGICPIANNTIVRGNKIENVTGSPDSCTDGVLIYAPDRLVYNVTVEDNVIKNIYHPVFGEGIWVGTAGNGVLRNVRVTGNVVENVTDNSILVSNEWGGTSNNVIVANNTIRNATNRGILLYHVNGNVGVVNNSISYISVIAGIGVEHSTGEFMVQNNTISNITSNGIHILNTSNVEILGNLIDSNTDGETGVKIEHSNSITIENNSISNMGWNGIKSTNSNLITIEGNTLSNISGSGSVEGEGIRLANTTSIMIKDNEFSNIPMPMYLTNCSQVSIVSNNASEIQDTFIFAGNGGDYYIANNTAHGFTVNWGPWGFGIAALTNNTVIEGNTIYDANALGERFDAVWIGTWQPNTSAHNVTVRNNHIDNLYNASWAGGIVLWVDSNSSASNVVIADNHVRNLTSKGILIDALRQGDKVSKVTVKNNVVSHSRNDEGIVAFKATEINFINNTVINSRGGIHFYNVSRGVISGNIVENATEWPGIIVDVNSSDILIKGNHLQDINSDGVKVIISSNVSVNSNILDGARFAGVAVVGSSDVLVKNNSVSGTDAPALVIAGYFVNNNGEWVLTNTSRNVLVENNVFNGGYHPNDLVYIGDHSSNVTLIRNVILDPGGSGVAIYKSSNVSVEKNTIKNAGHSGVFIHNSSEVLVEGNSIKNVSWACVDLTGNTNNSGITVVENNLSVARSGVWIGSGNSGVEVHFNNIVNVSGGVLNDRNNDVVNASLNWWGDVSGPSGAGLGSGAPVSSNVIYKPWLNAPYPSGKAISGNGSKSSVTLNSSEGIIINATQKADTVVLANGSGSVEASVIKYSANPVSPSPPKAFKFIDVHINSSSAPSMIKVRIYYKASELKGLSEAKITPYWWDGSKWVKCSDYRVNTTDQNGYSGYVEITITSRTTPSLTNLTGTPISLGSPPPLPPIVGGTIEVGSPLQNRGTTTIAVTTFIALAALGIIALRKRRSY